MAELPRNQELFNLIAAEIFAELNQAFPVPLKLDPVNIGVELEVEDWPKAAAVAMATLEWLLVEGYIRDTQERRRTVDSTARHGLQLTHKGRLVLNKLPELLEAGGRESTWLKTGLKVLGVEVAKEAAKWGMQQILVLGQRYEAAPWSDAGPWLSA